MDALVKPKKGLENIACELDGNVLILRVDLMKPVGKTGNGKATLIATTHGVQELVNGTRLNINITRD